MKKVKKILNGKEFFLFVDYSKNIKQLIKEGEYEWSYIESHGENLFNRTIDTFVPESGIKEITCSLKKFEGLDFDEIILKMTQLNSRPAVQNELLVFGKKYPKLQKRFPIIALGSYWENGLHEKHGSYLYWSIKTDDFDNPLNRSIGGTSINQDMFPHFFERDIKRRGVYALWDSLGKKNCYYLTVKI